jgi:hypothetical protein
MRATQEVTWEVVKPQNLFTIEQIRDGEVIHSEVINNAVATAGFNAMLNTFFGSEAKRANWYVGLINATGYTAVADADTMASHAGWAEFATYGEATRSAWVATSSSNKSVTGTASQTFTIGTVSAQELKGLFVTDTGTKNGTTGLLWATALFSANVPVATGDTFRITYTMSLGN